MSRNSSTTPTGSRWDQFGRLARWMQIVIAVLFVGGLVTGNPSVVVNAGFALAVTVLPAVIERDYEVVLSPVFSLWITGAVTLHSFGMVWFYDTVWWWDHLTHAISASIVAGIGYTTARVLDRYSDAVAFPREFLFVYIVVFTIAFGVLWEVLEFAGRILAIEFGFEPVLKQYGLQDTMLDLVFDIVGAVLFAVFGSGPTSDIVDSMTERLVRTDGGTEE